MFNIHLCFSQPLANLSDDDDDDLSESADELSPADRLQYVMTVSQRAHRPDSQMSQTYHFHNEETLLQQTSLIGVYTCMALGKIFLNVDVLRPLGVLKLYRTSSARAPAVRRNLWDEDYDDREESLWIPTSFDEANLHRYFMPFQCAQILCDRIVPDRLATVAARHMAETLPVYHSGISFLEESLSLSNRISKPVFMLTKYCRDLRFNVDREYELHLVRLTTLSLPSTESIVRPIIRNGYWKLLHF